VRPKPQVTGATGVNGSRGTGSSTP
jgi:hypothetical protein